MKLQNRAIIGAVFGFIVAYAFFIASGLAMAIISFLFVLGTVILFLSDSNLKAMARNKKLRKERRREEDKIYREGYNRELGKISAGIRMGTIKPENPYRNSTRAMTKSWLGLKEPIVKD